MTDLSKEHLKESLDRLEKRDYEYDLIVNNSSNTYKTSVEGILNFASKGTSIALEMLNDNRTKQENWQNDKEIATTIKQLVQSRLKPEIERHWGLHFAFNSMCFPTIVETYMRMILDGRFDGSTNGAISFLYEIENKGNIEIAVKQLSPILQLIRG